jgi:lysine 2,3-aminomutase
MPLLSAIEGCQQLLLPLVIFGVELLFGPEKPFMAHRPQTRQTWEHILAKSVTSAEELLPFFDVSAEDIKRVVSCYPMRINPYYLGLMKKKGDGIFVQGVPDPREVVDLEGEEDPLKEEDLSPVPGLTHKYPDRVLLLVSNQCAMFCRFCNRKRKVGRSCIVTEETIREGLSYIKKTPSIRDVLLSGGDPLLLQDRAIFSILSEIRSVDHVEIVRIGTRTPCTLPQRITPRLTRILKSFHPLYISTHFNHPDEVTPASARACGRLADAGIPLGCQTVLLKGVNDRPDTMSRLMCKLLMMRVRPYYLFQADLVRGTSHFWTPLQRGLEIMSSLHKSVPGIGRPQFVIDLPGGGGKVPLLSCNPPLRH